MNNFFYQETPLITQQKIDEFSENIDIEESLTAQHQTLVWNEEKYLRLAPGHKVYYSMSMRKSYHFRVFIWDTLENLGI